MRSADANVLFATARGARRADLLDLELPPADLTPYEPKPNA